MIKQIGKALIELYNEGKVDTKHYHSDVNGINQEEIMFCILETLRALKIDYKKQGTIIKLLD